MDKTNDHIFIRMQLIEKIKLEPAFISRSYKDEVLKRLKTKVEGICTKHGYIRTDSVEINKVCSGRVELIGLNGSTVFDVYFWADVCNPLLGSVLKCRVSNINKFGILVEAGNIIEAIVAKNSVSIQSDVDLDKVRIGDDVMVEVVGKKYELNDKKISLIARIVKNKDEVKTFSMKKSAYETDDNEDDDDIRLIDGGDIGIDADNEEEEEEEEEDEEDDDNEEDEDNDDALDEEGDVEDLEDDVVSKKGGNFFSDDDDDYFNKTDDDLGSDIVSDNGSNGDESD
jgi:DNA-directed RNA polymerase subunit E'/Rpb7